MRRDQWRRVVRTPMGAAAATGLAVLVVLAIVAPAVWGGAAEQMDIGRINQPPSSQHWFGTDNLGRDVLMRVLVATRTSLLLAMLASGVGVALGLILGTLPAVLGKRAGRLVVAAVNFLVAFPALLLALFFAVIFGIGARGAVLAIGFAIAPVFARLVQTLTASVEGRDYVAAARLAGAGRFRIVSRHILPNIAEPLAINATMVAGAALLAFSGLSFLGLGVQPPHYDWGRLLGEGLERIYVNPAAALAPGIAVVFAGLAFALLGEAAAAVFGLRTGVLARLPARYGAAQVPSLGLTGTAPLGTPARSPAVLSESVAEAESESIGSGSKPTTAAPAVVVRNLSIQFPTSAGWVRVVDEVSFSVTQGECVGVVGESGSGKSVTALAIAGLLPDTAVVTADRLDVLGDSMLGASERQVRERLGTSLAMVFQDPMVSFNPTMRVGPQLAEVARFHHGQPRTTARAAAITHMQRVRIPAAAQRERHHPHQFSGGMLQRAMIAMGLIGQPRLIIADEPTTALDVLVQEQVIALLQEVRRDSTASVVLISHDIALIAGACDRVLVMYGGQVMEDAPADRIVTDARHPYTRALLAAVPDMAADRDRELATIAGRPPEAEPDPAGCPFAPRCELADDRCRSQRPPLEPSADTRLVACWHALGSNSIDGERERPWVS